MKKLLENDEEDRSFIEVRAAGSILHDFYSGIEKIFRRVAVAMNNKLPKNEDWHKELLSQMAEPIAGIRANLKLELFEFLENIKKEESNKNSGL